MEKRQNKSRAEKLIEGYLNQSLTEKEMAELDAWVAANPGNGEKFEFAIEGFIDVKVEHKISDKLEKQISSNATDSKWLSEKAKAKKNDIILNIARRVLDREPRSGDFEAFSVIKSDEINYELLLYKEKAMGQLQEKYSSEFINIAIDWEFIPNEFYKKLIAIQGTRNRLKS